MTVGAIPYVIVSLAIFGMVLMIAGFILDVVEDTDLQLRESPDLPYSKNRSDTMGVLILFFNAMGFVALISAFILLIMNANQRETGEI